MLKVIPRPSIAQRTTDLASDKSVAAAREPLFELDAVTFAIAERVLLEPLTLNLPARRVVGLIGHNGSGKSTLVKLLARQQPVSTGTIRFEARRSPNGAIGSLHGKSPICRRPRRRRQACW
jgi:ABC-type bacteriocin/lantibiotic exporter with double-glycine peptidase domain